MEAPEKIYLTPLECMAASFQPKEDNTIEYTRTDAFIEKAAEWLSEIENGTTITDIDKFVEDFKKAMRQ